MPPKKRRCANCKRMLPIEAFGATRYARDCEACRNADRLYAETMFAEAINGLQSLGYSASDVAATILTGQPPPQ